MARPKEGCGDLFVQIPTPLLEALRNAARLDGRTVTGQVAVILQREYPGALPELPPPRKRGRPPKALGKGKE